MSAAACVKKISCNAPVPALSVAAERTILEFLEPAVEAGEVKPEAANALILERAAMDENYAHDHMEWVGRVISALSNTPAAAGKDKKGD